MITALVDPNVAFDVAYFLEGALLTSADVPEEKHAAWRDVIDALFALSNETKAIVASEQVAAMLQANDAETAEAETWMNCVMASNSLVELIADGELGAQNFVWSDEGTMQQDKFTFDRVHRDLRPLIVDRTSAQKLVKVHAAADGDNQAKFAEWIGKSRGHFRKMWKIAERNDKTDSSQSS